MKIIHYTLVLALSLTSVGESFAEENKAPTPAQPAQPAEREASDQPGPRAGLVQPESQTPTPLVCPIIGLNSGAITAGAVPALSELRTRITALNQQLQQQRGSNPQCAMAGQSAFNLVQSISQTGMCEQSPVNCSQNLAEVAQSYVNCPAESRDSLIDITLSTVMAFGAGTPIGILGLGASAINSVIRLFRGRSQERAQQNDQRQVRLAQQTFVDGLASCATSDLYSTSVCTGPQRNRLGETLRSLNHRVPCSAPVTAPTTVQAREFIASLRSVDTCLTAPPADPQRCLASLPPATQSNALDKGACLMANTGGSFAEVLEDSQNANLQDSLQMARRFHIQKIISLREEARRDDNPRIREQLILNCYLGRLSMSVSSTQNQETNPLVAAGRQNELEQQDEADDRTIYRGYPNRSDDPNIVVRPARLSQGFASAQAICNQLDTCFQGRDTFSNREFEGSNLRAQMCRGLSRLNDRNGLIQQYNYMAFDINVDQGQVSCREPAAVPRREEPASDGTRVNQS